MPVRSSAQTDVYLAGLAECMPEQDFTAVTKLYAAIDQRIHSYILGDAPYFGFALQYCTGEPPPELFTVKKGSELDALIRAGLATGLWRAHPPPPEGQPELVLIPPGGAGPPRDPATSESIAFDPAGSFVTCSVVYTLQPHLSRVWERYDRYSVANSKVKLSAMLDFFEAADYNLASVRYFIALDIILQRMLLLNDYRSLR